MGPDQESELSRPPTLLQVGDPTCTITIFNINFFFLILKKKSRPLSRLPTCPQESNLWILGLYPIPRFDNKKSEEEVVVSCVSFKHFKNTIETQTKGQTLKENKGSK
jgi:hypothetical protein